MRISGWSSDVCSSDLIADEYGIGAQVNFTGWLSGEQVAHTYSESDVFVLPSLIENQPMSILEAMAHRLPVIASNVGAIATQVLDDETGLLVPPGDAAALADALDRLDRKSVVWGRSVSVRVDRGVRRILKKKKKKKK